MNVQARINVQVGKFSKINNCADWNKDVQAGIFLEINKLCSTIIRETRVHILSRNQLCKIFSTHPLAIKLSCQVDS